MADYGAPVATQVNPGGGLKMLSDLLNIRQQQQALQAGQIGIQQQQAQLQQSQQTASQRTGLASWFKDFDPTSHLGEDGTLDLNSVFQDPKLRAAAGDQFPQVMQQMQTVKQNQLQTKTELAKLNKELRSQLSDALGSLRTDPDVVADNEVGRAKVSQSLGNWAETGGEDAARIANVYGRLIQHTPKGKLSGVLSNMQLMGMSAGEQAGRQMPSYLNTGGGFQQINPQAAGPGYIPATIPPGWEPVTDAYGRLFLRDRQNPSRPPVFVGGGNAPGVAPTEAGPSFAQPAADQPAIMEEIRNTRANTQDAGANRNINAHLLELSQTTATGPVSALLNNAAAAVGLPQGSSFQEIEKYLARQSTMQMHAMGLPNTNAAMATAEHISGTTTYTPQALRESVMFADALNSASMAYRQGLDRVVGTGSTPNLANYQSFRAAWARNFDPDFYRVDDAIRRGDQEELAAIKKRLGEKGLRELAIRGAKLRQLEQGQIPQ